MSWNKLKVVRCWGRVWRAIALSVLAAMALPVNGQQPVTPAKGIENDAAELYQSLLDLQNPWTVMCVAAHPDDEDGATLTLLRRKYGVHTVTVFSTYGEGGQNAVGPELYEELGVIRSRETKEAARIQGSEAYFLGLRDFGFSKSSAEAFRFWNHDEALSRMVLKIRQLRPDIIITNHDTTSGHGHHQATGILVLEAFDAAADPGRFPEQLRGGLKVWQPQRLFVRFQFEGGGSKTAEDEAGREGRVISINRNERDQLRGSTYAEQALRALQQHATQGPWPQTVPANWPAIRYRLARSAKDAAAFPANAQTFLDGLRLPQPLAEKLTPLSVQALLPLYSANAHDASILGALVAARKGELFAVSPATSDQPRFQLMTERLNHALVVASGIGATLASQNDVLIPGTTTNVSLRISNDGQNAASIQRINLRGLRPSSKLNFPQTLAPGKTVTVELEASTPRTANISVPREEHLYDGKFFGEELGASITVEVEGAAFPVEAVTRLNVAPAVEIESINPSPLVITPATINRPTAFTLHVTNHLDTPFKGEIIAREANGSAMMPRTSVDLADGGTREYKIMRSAPFKVTDFGRGSTQQLSNTVSFTVAGGKHPNPVTKRSVKVIWSDARVAANVRVGYLKSFDDTLRTALAALGVEAQELTVNAVQAGDLSKYQAIIIDNRGYQAHPELISANARLLDYVKAGGTLIVFYHKTNEWNPDQRASRPQLAPYPIILGNSRVTDETAAIVFSEPQHPLLNYPNKITPEDFAGWIQERGLYYPQTWDSHYSAPLAMSDEKEVALRGGLLAAEYGRGRYIYTSLVWYRQLRAGIPGAYRVLANMISYGR